MAIGENFLYTKVLMDQIKQSGLPIILLVCAIWYFYTEDLRLNDKIDVCHQEMMSIYEENQNELKEVIVRNTEALKDLKQNQVQLHQLVDAVTKHK